MYIGVYKTPNKALSCLVLSFSHGDENVELKTIYSPLPFAPTNSLSLCAV